MAAPPCGAGDNGRVLSDITPTRARRLLDEHGLRTRRRLGQHLLVDANTVRRIVRLASVSGDDTVLEIGPGIGSLTVGVARVARRVVAVEVDEGLADVLRGVVAAAPNVEVLVADALRCNLPGLLDGEAKLVANLPYNIATPVFARVLDEVPQVRSGLIMVQRELGERWTAAPGSRLYGAISVKAAFHAQTRVVGEVPRTVFLPPPRVSSVLVAFQRRPAAADVEDPSGFLAFVARVFGYRRKTLPNALARTGVDRGVAARATADAGLESTVRPEQVSVEGFAELWRRLNAAGEGRIR